MSYPLANGHVENTNRTILDEMNKKLDSVGRSWLEELPYVLWAHYTTPRRATKGIPFSLTYGFEPKRNEEAMKIEMEF